MKRNAFLAVFIFFLISTGKVKAESWNGIHPIASTRPDVERILGKPLGDVSARPLFLWEGNVIKINYAYQSCQEGGRWNLPKWAVTGITIYFRSATLPALSDREIDLKDFVKSSDSDYLINRAKGIYFQLYKEKVYAIYYTPTENEAAFYECK